MDPIREAVVIGTVLKNGEPIGSCLQVGDLFLTVRQAVAPFEVAGATKLPRYPGWIIPKGEGAIRLEPDGTVHPFVEVQPVGDTGFMVLRPLQFDGPRVMPPFARRGRGWGDAPTGKPGLAVLRDDGAVVGMRTAGGGAWIPAEVLDLLDVPLRGWVRVSGGSVRDPEAAGLGSSVGRALADAGLGIIHHGGPNTAEALHEWRRARPSGRDTPRYSAPENGQFGLGVVVLGGAKSEAIEEAERLSLQILQVNTEFSSVAFDRVIESWLRGAPASAPDLRPVVYKPANKLHAVSDQPEGDDLLDVKTMATRFAKMAVSKQTAAPLAFGLFGEWGSGKSFFMKEMKKAAEALVPEVDEKPRTVCQIEFNAWHYVDANLWASLGASIFDGIAKHLGMDKDEQVDQERRRIREALVSSSAACKETKTQLEANKEALREATAELAKVRGVHRERLSVLDPQFVGRLWKELDGGAQVRKRLEKAGLAQAYAGAAALQADAKELAVRARTLEGRARALATVVTRWRMLLLMVGLLVGPWALAYALDNVFESHVLAALSGLTTTAVALGAGLLAFLRRHADGVEVLLTRGGDLREAAIRVVDGIVASKTEVTKAAEAERDAAADEEDARLRVSTHEAAITAGEARLAELGAGKMVYELVAGATAEDGLYRSAEGLVSILRRDLETLRTLLETQQEAGAPAIRRIVLYIDDLDRCPHPQVVRLLQAVHLLLAFDLFVVVVGVDPRWLELSLEREYGNLLGAPGRTASTHHAAASAQEYLEKIFQVPYTLRRMSEAGFRDMVLALLPPVADTADPGGAEVSGTPAKPAPTAPAVPDAETSPTSPAGVEPDAEDLIASGVITVTPAVDFRLEPVVPDEKQFLLDPVEQEFMARLHGFIGTPRLLKRFVNSYRLIRAGVAGAADDVYGRFISDEEFRVVQVQLALNVGMPRFASKWLHKLDLLEGAAAAGSVADLLKDESIKTLGLNEHERQEADSARPLLTQMLSEGVSADRAVWARWAPQVGRYSAYW